MVPDTIPFRTVPHTPVTPSAPDEPDARIVIVMPVYNDWPAVAKLLPLLDETLFSYGVSADVLLVNDASSLAAPRNLLEALSAQAILRVDILDLRRNLGHQRAIAIGLAYLADQRQHEAIVVMDSDGEDAPGDIPRLLDRFQAEGEEKIVFAERTKRSESISFRVLYGLYRLLHRVLTGRGVRVGNFSVIPRSRLDSLVVVSELWNHYAAAAFVSRQPTTMIPTARATRLAGESRMNFVSLASHGLSAISVYAETVGVRLLVATSILILLALTGIGVTIGVRLLTEWAIPGWATFTAGICLTILLQAIMFSFIFSFAMLAARHGATFIPLRDYRHFLHRLHTLTSPRPNGLTQHSPGSRTQ